MAITKEKKGKILEKIKDIIDKSKSVVFVNFHGLSVGDTTSMRSKLREEGVGYFVSKKTLTKIALEESKNDSKIKGDIPSLDGELALAYSGEDETTAAREIYEIGKKFKVLDIFSASVLKHCEFELDWNTCFSNLCFKFFRVIYYSINFKW